MSETKERERAPKERKVIAPAQGNLNLSLLSIDARIELGEEVSFCKPSAAENVSLNIEQR